ncbi:MAG: nucleotidyltransferase domain-containing protein [Alteromonadaceae bacterium]|nr:nucleotidyltransferase domain-containing protein [Alteromonadaceae bacterium]
MQEKAIQNLAIQKLVDLANKHTDVEVLWLYGSRARNIATETSDYDLAVAFKTYIEDPLERRLRPELLALEWHKALGIKLSILDINQATIQLAYTVVQDNTYLYSGNDYRRLVEEQRIMSKWEIDHLYHRKHYG